MKKPKEGWPKLRPAKSVKPVVIPAKPVQVAPVKAGSHVPVSVIVIGRNVAPWVAGCLRSIKSQSVIPDAIVFVDDASTDETAAIVRKVPGVKLVARDENGGMNAARMDGVDATSSPLLLFVDGDNELPPYYLATMVAELTDDLDFVYPGKVFFGDSARLQERKKFFPDGTWTPPVADREKMWGMNYADTCSLVRRDAFLAVGGWRGNPADTMFDWDLFLRMSARGGHARSSASMLYRVHDDNWSERERGVSRIYLNGLVRKHAATITVATMWSGRLKKFGKTWLAAVQSSLQAAGKTAELLVMDDSKERFPVGSVDRSVFTSIEHVIVRRGSDSTATRRPDRFATAEFLSGVCNDILRRASGDVVWFIEDDILVPTHAASELLDELLARTVEPRAAVCGCYLSRHSGQTNWILARYEFGRVVHLTELPKDPFAIDLTGTGCLMVLRDLLAGTRFAVEWQHDGKRSPAHDWTFSQGLARRGRTIVAVPAVVCEHVSDV